MSFLDPCAGVTAGVSNLACIAQQAHYYPTYLIIIGLFLILFIRLRKEDIKLRVAATAFAISIITFLFTVMKFLPPYAYAAVAVLAVGSVALLAFSK